MCGNKIRNACFKQNIFSFKDPSFTPSYVTKSSQQQDIIKNMLILKQNSDTGSSARNAASARVSPAGAAPRSNPGEATAPAGEYQVELGFYSPATMQRLLIFQQGEAVADRLLLSPIQVQGRTQNGG